MDERNFVNITVTMSREERKALKQFALDNDISVSALIRKWLEEEKQKAEAIKNGKEERE